MFYGKINSKMTTFSFCIVSLSFRLPSFLQTPCRFHFDSWAWLNSHYVRPTALWCYAITRISLNLSCFKCSTSAPPQNLSNLATQHSPLPNKGPELSTGNQTIYTVCLSWCLRGVCSVVGWNCMFAFSPLDGSTKVWGRVVGTPTIKSGK